MDNTDKEPVSLAKALNLRELMRSDGTEFHIDTEFKQKPTDIVAGDDDLFDHFPDEEDSDPEDVLKNIEASIEHHMLSCPEYQSFQELAAKMIDCDTKGNVKLLILEEGEGPLVPPDAEVTMHYAAYWEKEQKPFDSTLTMNFGNPITIRLGRGEFIPGLELGLSSVRGPSARILLLLSPDSAWGKMGVPPRIKPERALFIVCLYAVKDTLAHGKFNDLPSEEQSKFEVTLRTVNSLHEQARDYFKNKKYLKCITNYQRSLTVINISKPETEEEGNQIKELKIKSYLNLALCYYKLEKSKHVLRMLEALDYITDVDKNCKALFYKAKAYELMGKSDVAIEYYKKALKIEPKNKDIGKALDNLDGYLKNSAKNEKAMWQSVFKTEKKEVFKVDEDFKNSVQTMFEELSNGEEFAKLDLPTGLSSDEIGYVKDLVKGFKGLVVHEEGQGRKKRVQVIKKLIY